MISNDKVKALVLGHAVGDALGVPVEFNSRESLFSNPVRGMRDDGTHHMPAGCWSDDTSMTLALMDIIATKGTIDYTAIMMAFSQWLHFDAYTATSLTFDVGNATQLAISRFDNGTDPLFCGGTGSASNGNGSLMRIAPAAFYLYERYDGQLDQTEPMAIVHEVSALTHAHARSQMACGIYVLIVSELLAGLSLPRAISEGLKKAHAFYLPQADFAHELKDTYIRLWNPDFKDLPITEIKSSGYVVDTLEAVLWCLLTTDDYQSCVLKAVNLGGDTDTIGAIAGGLAALAYGLDSVPKEWLDTLIKKKYIEEICDKFTAAL